MSHPGHTPTAPPDLRRLKSSANVALGWSIVCWVIVGILGLGFLSGISQGGFTITSVGFLIGTLIGMLLFFGPFVLVAVLLGRRRKRLLREIAQAQAAWSPTAQPGPYSQPQGGQAPGWQAPPPM